MNVTDIYESEMHKQKRNRYTAAKVIGTSILISFDLSVETDIDSSSHTCLSPKAFALRVCTNASDNRQ